VSPAPTTASRRTAERGGRRAETLAAMLMRLKGFSIIAARHRTPLGELDLVAKRGKLIAFVEVKARASRDAAVEAVTYGARQRIRGAAGLFLSRRPDLADCAIRYDIVAVSGWRLEHLPDAWRDGE
jgi:putative endonuclease